MAAGLELGGDGLFVVADLVFEVDHVELTAAFGDYKLQVVGSLLVGSGGVAGEI